MIKRQIAAFICLSFLFAPVFAAQVAIVQTDTRQEAWAKETLNNSDLQTNIDGKETADAAIVKSDEAETLTAAWDLGTPSAGVGTNLTGIPYTGLADGTDGQLITWGADAKTAVVATGTADQVLTSNGPGAAPTFQDATGGSSPLAPGS